jgi:hypothetical protein
MREGDGLQYIELHEGHEGRFMWEGEKICELEDELPSAGEATDRCDGEELPRVKARGGSECHLPRDFQLTTLPCACYGRGVKDKVPLRER